MSLGHRSPVAAGFVAALFLATSLLAVAGAATAQPAVPTVAAPHVVYVNLTIAPAGIGYRYSSNLLTLPVHTTIVVRIVSLDPRVAPPLHASDISVAGTIGGRELVLQGTTSLLVSSVLRLSETFSILGPGIRLNAPIPPAMSVMNPTAVAFSFEFNQPGYFVWTTNVMSPGTSIFQGHILVH